MPVVIRYTIFMQIFGIASKINSRLSRHRYGLTLGIFLAAAVITGVVSVLFMWAFEYVYNRRLDTQHIGLWGWLVAPVLFLISIELIRRFAPSAEGAGIPQTIFAAKHLTAHTHGRLSGLVSLNTMIIKMVALLIGLWAGASTGREGPTVHIAACLFFAITYYAHRLFKLPFDMRSAVIAGGAAGLAAAFNTPLAGVTFAIEELSSESFATIKETVLIAIIIAGIAAQSLTGEYTYFGRLNMAESANVAAILLTGVLGGLAGAFFATILTVGRGYIAQITGYRKYFYPILLALSVLAIYHLTNLQGIQGPGNIMAQHFIRGKEDAAGMFLVSKMAATIFTYWSGIAGGIFAPCLSMGSAVGAVVGQWLHNPISTCAMMGMAAFLAGTIQAPMTSFVIIYEMTGRHEMLLPIMLASLIGYMISRLFGARHLYQTLASFYIPMLSQEPTKK